MHIGHNLETKYSLRDKDKLIELQVTREEKDLGMYVTADLKPARQCTAAAAKAIDRFWEWCTDISRSWTEHSS